MTNVTVASQILTFKYRILPTRRQHRALEAICEAQRILYNAALEERIDFYRKTGKPLSYMTQAKSLKAIRDDDPCYGEVALNISRATLQRLHGAFDGFFRRIKRGHRAGFPRFKSKSRWDSFGFAEFCGIKFDGKRIRFKGLPGALRVHKTRDLPKGKITSCQFRRDTKGWHICIQVKVATAPKRTIESAVGIDVGLKAFAYQSDGIAIPAPSLASRAHKELRRRQRALARCKRGSNRRKKVRLQVTRLHGKIANSRRTWLHQQSARIVKSYDLIAVEDLRVANMLKNEHLARSISDAGWRIFTDMLAYKVAKTGGTFIRVSAKNTTQECSCCGAIVPKGLADRVHSCPTCGLTLDRDHNAALNILHRAGNGPGTANVAGYSERSFRNMCGGF